ncbi:hypothetical protein [Carbonactinospora thermoautotrophica]|uniref:hypothetical protein n=1 Tax=Carbonactinospora thermoautotrophica TaxID=1469144 RepID=UPI00082C6A2C|nr:hypothetical protein [Carbonactinospora thermoautotrophica]
MDWSGDSNTRPEIGVELRRDALEGLFIERRRRTACGPFLEHLPQLVDLREVISTKLGNYPRQGRYMTCPSCSSARSASRTGAMLMSKPSAIFLATPQAMPAAIARRKASRAC